MADGAGTARAVGGSGGQCIREKTQPRFAQDAGVIGRFLVQRIQRDDGRGVENVDALHEAVGIAIGPGKLGPERGALVVISHHQDGGRTQSGQHAREAGIGGLFAPMREIAGHDHEGNVLVRRIDFLHGDREPLCRVQPVKAAAARHEMRIGEDDELHRCMVSRSHMA